jgi:hypothetical protein
MEYPRDFIVDVFLHAGVKSFIVLGFAYRLTDWQKRASLTDTLTICSDEHLSPSNQIPIYGYIIMT